MLGLACAAFLMRMRWPKGAHAPAPARGQGYRANDIPTICQAGRERGSLSLLCNQSWRFAAIMDGQCSLSLIVEESFSRCVYLCIAFSALSASFSQPRAVHSCPWPPSTKSISLDSLVRPSSCLETFGLCSWEFLNNLVMTGRQRSERILPHYIHIFSSLHDSNPKIPNGQRILIWAITEDGSTKCLTRSVFGRRGCLSLSISPYALSLSLSLSPASKAPFYPGDLRPRPRQTRRT